MADTTSKAATSAAVASSRSFLDASSSSPSHPRQSSPAERCDRDALSHIFSFLNLREYRFILTISREWNCRAHVRTSWPQFDTSAYIRLLLTSPQANSPVRSLAVNNPVIGRAHLTDTNNEEYLTKRLEYHEKYHEAPEVQYYVSLGQAHSERAVERKSHQKWIIETQTKAGGEFIANCVKKNRVYSQITKIELLDCNKEFLLSLDSSFSSLRAIRWSRKVESLLYKQPQLSSQLCNRLEVLEMHALIHVSARRFLSLRVLRIDWAPLTQLVQLRQLQYLSLESLTVDAARAVRYLSVRHQLRSFVIVGMEHSCSDKVENDATPEKTQRAIDALAIKKWNEMRERVQLLQSPLDDLSLDDLPPALLTHLDSGPFLLSAQAFVSICRVTSLRRLHYHCTSVGSLANLPVVELFLSQLEYFDTASVHQETLDRCQQLKELRIVNYTPGFSLSHLNQLRVLTLEYVSMESWMRTSLPNQLEQLTIRSKHSKLTKMLDLIASSVAPLLHFQCLTLIQSDLHAPPLIISSHSMALVGESSIWSTLQVLQQGEWNPKRQPDRPEEVWNIDASSEQLNEATITLANRVRRSFRVHLTQLELVYRIGLKKETGQSEWQLDNQ